ncbi:transcription-repair coupling factor (superfamily II helicase) [Methylobacterium fujisawaense]|uniref:Transcription-repair coupling factor (Superfamily II helicase) n=1 Tax=Methylobacterium fujisawaense TaxID=107400 RepID=A0ABR6DFB1_9HYPH|nr:transcription-repair coupling factor (superfamily II helicase) [Methylobacterium fujisawaense]
MAKRRTKAGAHQGLEDAPLMPTGALAVALLAYAEGPGPVVHVARDARRLEDLAATLRALDPDAQVAIYPEWDCLPFDHASPSRAMMGARAAVLRWLTDREALPDFVLTTAPALVQRVPPPETWASARVTLRVGDPLDVAAATADLKRLGYILDERVDEPGEIAVRGRTVEVFPAAAPRPCRIEHAEGRVTAIRSYDPISQRSVAEADELVIDPATEIILEPGSGQSFEPFTGQEHRLDRYYPRLVTLLDYVPGARLAVEDGTQARVDAFFEQMDEARGRLTARDAQGQPGAALYLTPEAWRAIVAAHGRLAVTEAAGEPRAMPTFAGERRPGTAFAKVLRERLKAGDVVVLAGSVRPLRRLVRQAGKIAERPIRLIDAWADVAEAAPGDVLALEAPLAAGFRVPEQGATVIAAADLFGPEAAVTGGARAILPMGEVDLRPGDVAVDRDHGLCVFEGLEAVTTRGEEPSEALRLRFSGDAILMVPVTQADRIWRYGPEPDAVTLDKLDGGTWPRRRLEAEATMARTARLMLEAARARRETEAPVLSPPARDMERFAAGFGFAPTPDQAAAVDALMADLASGRPMDRLVCGDVGFGKTEVALRALAAAIFSGRQAALIAPTTVLARQHAETLRRRFGRFGVEVAQLSRLVAPAEAKRVKAGLADGTIRLVVGPLRGAAALRGPHRRRMEIRHVDIGAASPQRAVRVGRQAAAVEDPAGLARPGQDAELQRNRPPGPTDMVDPAEHPVPVRRVDAAEGGVERQRRPGEPRVPRQKGRRARVEHRPAGPDVRIPESDQSGGLQGRGCRRSQHHGILSELASIDDCTMMDRLIRTTCARHAGCPVSSRSTASYAASRPPSFGSHCGRGRHRCGAGRISAFLDRSRPSHRGTKTESTSLRHGKFDHK